MSFLTTPQSLLSEPVGVNSASYEDGLLAPVAEPSLSPLGSAASAATAAATAAVNPAATISSLLTGIFGTGTGSGPAGEGSWLGSRGVTVIAGLILIVVGLTMLRPAQQIIGAAARTAGVA